jgi:hypothetical protein
MALADELKTLQALHANGKLTDQEYTDAKAATLNLESAEAVTAKKSSFLSANQWRFPFEFGPVVLVCKSGERYSRTQAKMNKEAS